MPDDENVDDKSKAVCNTGPLESLHHRMVARIVVDHWMSKAMPRLVALQQRHELADAFYADRWLRNVFFRWRMALKFRQLEASVAQELYGIDEQQRRFEAFKALIVGTQLFLWSTRRRCWRHWLAALRSRQDARKVRQLRGSRARAVLQDTFSLWQHLASIMAAKYAQQEIIGLQHHRRILLCAAFVGWCSYTKCRAAKHEALSAEVQLVKRQYLRAKLRGPFLLWRSRWAAARLFVAAAAMYRRTLLLAAWRHWGSALAAARIWQATLAVAAAFHSRSVVRRCWRQWGRARVRRALELRMMECAVVHDCLRTERRAWFGLRQYVAHRRQKHTEENEARSLWMCSLLRRGVRQWLAAGTRLVQRRLEDSALRAAGRARRERLLIENVVQRWRHLVLRRHISLDCGTWDQPMEPQPREERRTRRTVPVDVS